MNLQSQFTDIKVFSLNIPQELMCLFILKLVEYSILRFYAIMEVVKGDRLFVFVVSYIPLSLLKWQHKNNKKVKVCTIALTFLL